MPEEYGIVEVDSDGNPKTDIELLRRLPQKGTPDDLYNIGIHYAFYGYQRITDFI